MGGGGMENGVANVSRNLPPRHFDLHVCCLRSSGVFSKRLKNPDQVYSLNKPPGLSIKCIIKLRSHILRIRPDIIHTHNLGPLIYTSIASFFARKQTIIHGEHAELTDCDLTVRRNFARRLFYPRCYAVHTVSNQLSRQLIELGFTTTNIQTIRNGVDQEKFAPTHNKVNAKEKLALPFLPDDSFVIGAVGRFGLHKRHSILVSAFDQLADHHDEVILVIAGDGGPEKTSTLKKISESKHKDRIHWLGFQEDIVAFYQGIDLLVAPSANEGMSNAVLEAMACAIPVLANKACGNAEILSGSGGGIVASMRNDSELTSILSRLVKSRKSLEAQGAAACQAVAAQFSIQRMAADYSEVYQRASGRL